METIKTQLTKAQLLRFTDKETGEVKELTQFTYLAPTQQSSAIGFDEPRACVKGNVSERFKQFIEQRQLVNITLDERYDQKSNSYKKTISKINDLEF